MWELIKRDIREHWRAAVFMLAAVAVLVGCFQGACISRIITGLPCPACGMTRAALLFLSGHWQESFRLQPFFFALVVGVLFFTVERYILRRERSSRFLMGYALFMLAAAFAFYIWRMVRYFPHTPPMTYNRDNLLACVYRLIVGKE